MRSRTRLTYADPQAVGRAARSERARAIGNIDGLSASDPLAAKAIATRSFGLRGQPTPREARSSSTACLTASGCVSGRIVGRRAGDPRDAGELAADCALCLPRCSAWPAASSSPIMSGGGSATSPRSPTASARAISVAARAVVRRRRRVRPARRSRSTRCSTASAALMEELRMLTDSLAHDLRSPVSRLALGRPRRGGDAAIRKSRRNCSAA